MNLSELEICVLLNLEPKDNCLHLQQTNCYKCKEKYIE